MLNTKTTRLAYNMIITSVAGLSITPIYKDQGETNKQKLKWRLVSGFEHKYSLRPTKLAHFESSKFLKGRAFNALITI